MTKTKTDKVEDQISDLEEEISELEDQIEEKEEELADKLAKSAPQEEISELEDLRGQLSQELADKNDRLNLLKNKLPEVKKETAKSQMEQVKHQAKEAQSEANQLREEFIEAQKTAFEVGREWKKTVDKAVNLRGKCSYLASKAGINGPNIPIPKQVDDSPEINLDNWWKTYRELTGEIYGKSKWDRKLRQEQNN